jgi:hypothetical protein
MFYRFFCRCHPRRFSGHLHVWLQSADALLRVFSGCASRAPSWSRRRLLRAWLTESAAQGHCASGAIAGAAAVRQAGGASSGQVRHPGVVPEGHLLRGDAHRVLVASICDAPAAAAAAADAAVSAAAQPVQHAAPVRRAGRAKLLLLTAAAVLPRRWAVGGDFRGHCVLHGAGGFQPAVQRHASQPHAVQQRQRRAARSWCVRIRKSASVCHVR